MDSNDYYRNFLTDAPFYPLKRRIEYNSGYLTDGQPGLQQAVHNLVHDVDGRQFAIVSGFEVSYDTATNTASVNSGYAFVNDGFKKIDSSSITVQDSEYIFLLTGGTVDTGLNLDDRVGLLLGQVSDTDSYLDLKNKRYLSGGRLVEFHSTEQEFYNVIKPISVEYNSGDVKTYVTDTQRVGYTTYSSNADVYVTYVPDGHRDIEVLTANGIVWWENNQTGFDNVKIIADITLPQKFTISSDYVKIKGGKLITDGSNYIEVSGKYSKIFDMDIDATACTANSDKIIYYITGSEYAVLDSVNIVGNKKGYGIYLYHAAASKGNYKISNCNLENLYISVYNEKCNDVSLSDNILFGSVYRGILLDNTDNCSMDTNNVSYCSGVGLQCYDSTNTIISNNIVNNIDGDGISVADNNIVSHNNCNNCTYHGISDAGTTYEFNTISNNNVSSNGIHGIYVRGTNSNIVSNKTYLNGGTGIQVNGNSNVIMSNSCEDGIRVGGSNILHSGFNITDVNGSTDVNV